MASSSRLAAVLVASVLASVLVITATHTYGLGITPDSVSYVAAADSFRRSGTFVTYDGSPFSAWPPLLSIVMAILGDGAPSAMRWFHVAVAGLIVCLSGAIMVPVVRRDMALACGLTALIAARPLQLTANFLWSEPLFLACVVGSALALAREWLYLSAALVSLACLTRYTGIVLLAAFMVCSYAALEKPSRRLIAWSIAAVPLAMWILRNVRVAGEAFGRPDVPARDPMSPLLQIGYALVRWQWPAASGTDLAASAVVAIGAVWLAVAWRRSREPAVRYLTLFGLLYGVLLCGIGWFRSVDAIDQRLISPLVTPLILTLTVACSPHTEAGISSRASIARRFIVLLWMISLAPQVLATIATTRIRFVIGAGGLARREWQTMPLVGALREEDLGGLVVSNKPYVVYWFRRVHTADVKQAPAPACDERVASIPRHLVMFSPQRTSADSLRDVPVVAGSRVLREIVTDGGAILTLVAACEARSP
jgi:hypothetical protein